MAALKNRLDVKWELVCNNRVPWATHHYSQADPAPDVEPD